MSPLFILWAIRGTDLIAERDFRVICIALFTIPNLYLGILIKRAMDRKIQRTIMVGEANDHRQDLISYLFAMLLPFYTVDLSSWSSLAATLAAVFIVFVLFMSLNLHYMNFFVALFGYHCFQVYSPENEHETSSAVSFMVITKRSRLRSGSRLTAYRISPSVLLEVP